MGDATRPATGAGYGVIEDAAGVTDLVVRAMGATPDARLRQIMASLVRHLHACARECALTEAELGAAIAFLNRIGQASGERHNEGVLFADAIGLSTLVCLMNNPGTGAAETAAALLGPFWREHAPATPNGGSILRSPTPGAALFVDGRVTDPAGRPLAGVEVDVWHASPSGEYENQSATQAEMNLRGRLVTDEAGRFRFRSVLPAGYPVPDNGPVGELLRAQGRHRFRPAHLHVLAWHPGFRTLITQVFVPGDPSLASDVVFGVTRSLIGDYRRHDAGTPPDPDVAPPWYTLGQDFVMQPGEAHRPIPPIP